MPRLSGVGQEELRRTNLSALLTRVHVSGPTTRAELTTELGLNRSTIGDLTAQLVEFGLVEEEQPTTAKRSGRPSLVVVPRRDVTVVAIDLAVDRIDVALVGLGGVVLDRRTRVHQRGEHDVANVVGSVLQMIAETFAAHADVHCYAAGVSVAGAVRQSDGLVHFAPNLGWVDEPFTELLADRLGLPVTTGNDANLGVLAEHLRGAAVGYQDVAYLSGSIGIGGGFLVGGEPLAGAGGYAGEIGHLLVDPDGPTCRCGNVGCWEMKVGENQLLTLAGRLPGGGPQAVAEVVAAAEAGDERAGASLRSVAHWTGIGLRSVTNVFNPEVLVIGGSLAQIFDAAEPWVMESLGRPISPVQDLRVCTAGLGPDSALLGAAEQAFSRLLADPLPVAGVEAGTG